MDMNIKLQDAFNEQINKELYSAYLYFSMATYFDATGLKGFSNWMKEQTKKKYSHAMRLYEHLKERGVRALMKPIDQPQVDFKSPLHVFEETLAHEKKVTKMIENLYGMANEFGDTAASIALQWFLKEQVEEEITASGIVEKLRMIKDKSDALFMLDSQLGVRG